LERFVRKFLISEVAELTGLSRGQIEQLISRHGIPVWARAEPGKAREFLPVDVFTFMLIGELDRLHVGHASISGIIASLNPYKLDPASGLPIEIFPGESKAKDRVLWIIANVGDGAEFVEAIPAEALHRELARRKILSPIIIDVTSIAALLREAAIKSRREAGDD
jgi:hypothetical protein